MRILSIDPGKQNGVAYFEDGKLDSLVTISCYEMFNDLFTMTSYGDLLIIEDSRMIKHIFQDNAKTGSKAKAMSIARDVGSIDCICSLIKDICDIKQITMISVSPKTKGKKLIHDEFVSITGWNKQTNQHERDAAMIGWNYRNAKLA